MFKKGVNICNFPGALMKPELFGLKTNNESTGHRGKDLNVQEDYLENGKLQLKVDELRQINEELLRQQKFLEESLKMHNRLTELVLNGGGIGAICNAIAEYTGCPVQVEDLDSNITVAPVNKKNALSCSRDLIGNSNYSKQVKTIFQERRAVEIVMDTDTIQYLVPIVAGEEILGLMTAILARKNIRQLAIMALEQGAIVMALEMLKQSAVLEHTTCLKEIFIEKVLEGNYESKDWVRHRALKLGIGLDNSYQIMVVKIEPHLKDKSKLELYLEIREFCTRSFPNIIVVTKSNHLLLISIFERHKNQDDAKTLAGLAKLLKEYLLKLVPKGTWWIALGACGNELDNCVLSYRNAVTTLDVMKTLKLKNKVVYHNNLDILSFIEINPQHFTQFIQKILGPLLEYDQKHKTQFFNTLKLYFKHNRNVSKASRKGYLSHSTMKYRLRRIKEISGLDLKNTEVCFQIQLALGLLNFDNQGDNQGDGSCG